MKHLLTAILGTGKSSPDIRKSIFTKVEQETLGLNAQKLAPQPLETFTSKIAHHAYKITDRDITHLKEEGFTEDQIFELAVTAAVSAGATRLNKGLDLLKTYGS